MTKVDFFKDQKGLRGFRATNHTGYALKGQDIVCAAVSVLTQTAALGLQEVLEIPCRLELAEARLLCVLPPQLSQEKEAEAQIVLKILYTGLTAVEAEYGKYLRVKEVPYRAN